MAKIGVFNIAPRKKFLFDSDSEVELEFISKDRMTTIIAKAESAAKKVGGNKSTLYDMFLGKAAVHGWNHVDQEKNPGHPGLLLPDGRPIPFSEENRNMLMKKSSDFSSFVFRYCTEGSNFLDESEAIDDQASLDDLVNSTNLEEEESPNA